MRARDRDAEPVVAGGEVEREVDRERRLAGAAVAVEHDVAALGDQHRVATAEQRIGTGLVDGDELAEGDGGDHHTAAVLVLPLGRVLAQPEVRLGLGRADALLLGGALAQPGQDACDLDVAACSV